MTVIVKNSKNATIAAYEVKNPDINAVANKLTEDGINLRGLKAWIGEGYNFTGYDVSSRSQLSIF